ncbi:hypothetical protein [Psychrobacillus sp. NPDC093180]|uniref:hypothetical protein n=1 Tax=Psychrobacillus sp. NPDC093180 TaxID=3364489 RepID=UPI00382441C0
MEIFDLMDPNGEFKKYRGFQVKPQVGNLIRILDIPKARTILTPNRMNTFKDLSSEKVYTVHRVVNVNQVVIRDDIGDSVHLTVSQYQVVEEISNKEIELLKQNREMLGIIDKMIKSKL